MDDDAANSRAFRVRAERLLRRAHSLEDVSARAGLVVEAALLHRLAVLCEAQERTAPMELYETATFAKPALDAQILGQEGEKHGLRGGPLHFQRAQDAYHDRDASDASAHRPHQGRKL